MTDRPATSRCGAALLTGLSLCLLAVAANRADDNHRNEPERVVALTDALFTDLGTVIVSQRPDIVYGRNVDYEAWPLAQVVTRAFPDWKELVNQDAALVLRARGGYEPLMMFSDALIGEAFVTRRIATRPLDSPYDCWVEGGSKHCDLGLFLVWTDGNYPERPQPWGISELRVVDFGTAFGNTIPDTRDNQVRAGFEVYRHYCIECHRINFQGGSKATDHVVRGGPVTRELLAFFVREYRRTNPATYMPDFNGILTDADIEALYRYLRHMYDNQNLCRAQDPDPRCPAD